jgi:glutathione S-transferase
MAFEALGLKFENVWLQFEELKTEKLLKINPQGKVPALETPEGNIFETTAILKFAARTAGKCGGETPIEHALVDQWLAWVDAELSSAVGGFIGQVYGIVQSFGLKAPDTKTLKEHILPKLAFLDGQLKGKHYIVNNKLTVADYSILNYVYPLFVFGLAEKERQALPNIVAYIENFATTTEFKRYYGRPRYCQFPFHVPKAEAPKKEEKPAAKKEDKPKEEKPKAAKKDDEDEYAEPKPKDPVFPETKLDLMNFKTFFVNEKDMDVAMNKFWEEFKDGEWSLWHLKYLKYPGECEVVYRTNNLLRTFMSRLEHVKKWIFGTQFVLGDEPKLEIEGVWLMRGPEIMDPIKEIDVFDTYKWDKLDSKNEQHRALIKDFWTHRKEDEEKVQGHTIRTFKWIK